MIVNYASSIINKLEALLTDAARVVIYDHHVFIVQATGVPMESRYACLLGVDQVLCLEWVSNQSFKHFNVRPSGLC